MIPLTVASSRICEVDVLTDRRWHTRAWVRFDGGPTSRGGGAMRDRGTWPWLAVFAVVFPTVVGGGILALPVALAPLGPMLAVAVTALIGVLNVLTIGLLALSVVRRADSLPPFARMGALSRDLLGRGAAVVTTVVVALLMFGLIVAYTLGLSHSLSTTVGLSAPTWAIAALAISAVLVGWQVRRALMTAGSVVTVSSILLLGTLAVLLARRIDPDLLLAGPPAPLGIPSFTLVFGALMGAYFGHTSVPTVAPAVLRRDPSGRSLVVGSVAAMTAATVVNTGWVFVTLGSTPAADYQAAGSTGIDLVSAVAGPVAGWLALAFVLLALGVAGMISAFVLGDVAIEQLPLPRSLELDLGSGSLLHARDSGSEPVVLTLAARPDGTGLTAMARCGRRLASEPITGTRWSATSLALAVNGGRPGRWLDAQVNGTHVRVRSTMLLEVDSRQASAAVRVLDDGPEGRLVALLLRRPRTDDESAAALGVSVAEAQAMLLALAVDGVVDQQDDGTWRVHLGRRRRVNAGHQVAVAREREQLDMAPRSPAWLATSTAARIVAIAPLVLALITVLALQASGATFARVFSLIGISAFVLVGTTIPVLIAIASRRSADRVVRAGLLGAPTPVLWAVWFAVVATCGAYAVVIYRSPGERIAAASAVVISLACALLARAAGAFRGSAALVLDVNDAGEVLARLTDRGVDRSVTAPERLPRPGRTFDVTIDPAPASPLRVVVHQATAPRQLVDLRAASAQGPIECVTSPRPGCGEVRPPSSLAPPTITWLVA